MTLSALVPLMVAAAATGAGAGAPPAGRYDAQLCVSVGTQAPSCGPVSAQVDPEGGITLRVHDFRYILQFAPPAVIVITMHGGMQVADALSTYRWAGRTLMFADPDRGLQYEVDFNPPPPAASGPR